MGKGKGKRRPPMAVVMGIKCPVGHARVWSIGENITRSGQKKRRYQCRVCARTFYAPEKTKGKGR